MLSQLLDDPRATVGSPPLTPVTRAQNDLFGDPDAPARQVLGWFLSKHIDIRGLDCSFLGSGVPRVFSPRPPLHRLGQTACFFEFGPSNTPSIGAGSFFEKKKTPAPKIVCRCFMVSSPVVLGFNSGLGNPPRLYCSVGGWLLQGGFKSWVAAPP